MDPLNFYLGTVVAIVLAVALRWNANPFAEVGAEDYAKIRARRTAGAIAFVVAAFSGVIGVLAQISLANP